MIDEIGTIRSQFTAHETLDGRIDQIFEAMKAIGFEALIYDYTPVPYDLDGAIMIPSLLKLRNISDDMHDYWFNRGYFRIDPVQQVALRTSTPFFWNYDASADTLIRRFMTEDTAPVARYLSERDMSTGVTVPVHMPRGDYATITGVRFGGNREFEQHALRYIADFNLLAHVFHETAYSLFDAQVFRCGHARLTERERECLRFSAEGLSAKEISRIIERSVPTVVMHLNAAAKKLGARNRTQAVVRATHYRMLEEWPSYNL
ncbi:LuxR family transcriptional regulator [Neorhizobium galegae]|uniref:LuxR family transcriptional regulator n=1 Tax=Neorhizobium galegae TaxID=399 RepID=UPI0006223F61|nr:LuxR family transcriptional regulator [Neorhizobium galegae]KAB1122301.1 LuxR family transcriptional regulator [Neorhizobium galegae]MCQ1805753.1 LuxR family transcriptional regulator [Neorhizobium galegae]CDZ58049.1 Transcriptional regulator ahyR/asaR family [Neorhizobium galegae bv. orientalis]CDZ68715.1 Transcriptional regulator ahyR/asaR family [Neorhizobium galegae bv. orientalis]